MSKKRRHFTVRQKTEIVRRHLVLVAVSDRPLSRCGWTTYSLGDLT